MRFRYRKTEKVQVDLRPLPWVLLVAVLAWALVRAPRPNPRTAKPSHR